MKTHQRRQAARAVLWTSAMAFAATSAFALPKADKAAVTGSKPSNKAAVTKKPVLETKSLGRVLPAVDEDVDGYAKEAISTDGYTGVVIVTTGYKVERSMSPKLRRGDGSHIWTGANATPDYAIEHGIVSYAKSLDEGLKLARAGRNPLILTAEGRYADNFRSDPILLDEDANRLLELDRKGQLLKKFRVVFIVD